MPKEKLKLSDEALQDFTIDEIVELKIELDELLAKLNSILDLCNNTLNS